MLKSLAKAISSSEFLFESIRISFNDLLPGLLDYIRAFLIITAVFAAAVKATYHAMGKALTVEF